MGRDGARWIEELPAGLAAQQGLLRGLLAFSQADPDVRWLVLGCSLARGAGDWLSDIDAAVGVVDEQLPGAFPRARSAVDGLGELVESFHHQLPGLALTHQRIFAQYADRSQLDLVVYPATVFAGAIPDVVVLYDPEGFCWPRACGWRSCSRRSAASWVKSRGRCCRRPWDGLSSRTCVPPL